MTNKLYKMMNWPAIEEIIYSESRDPHAILGPHKAGGQTLVQAFFPGAESASLVYDRTGETVEMEQADDDGFFAVLLPGTQLPAYHYEVKDAAGQAKTFGDPYRYGPQITQGDLDKFQSGIHYTVYEKLGAHPMELEGVQGTYFAVWAPGALRVSVVGDFNGWDGRMHQMRRLGESGVFELFVPGALEGQNYKYELKLKTGLTYLKADPYGNAAQLRPQTASVIADINGFQWEDGAFLERRAAFQKGNVPVNIYELYLGSFVEAGEGAPYAGYREIARKLVPYVKEMGYTHVELMPVMEHPLDASWGYQTIGYYAPTARYGSPLDFMYLVNELHKAGIGVILDWVASDFPEDVHGLADFDGTCLYEHPDPRRGRRPHWGTRIFNYAKPQVSNYLIANALFWVEKYHVDGIHINAVSSMLYLNYGKSDGQWVPNIYGGSENLEAIEFIKHLNSILGKRNPGVLTIAAEGTAFPNVTGSLEEGGLGFGLKRNNGFVQDYLRYICYDPYFRSYHHGELTFSMIYAYSEKFLLALSHGEVTHGKAAMLGKMPGGLVQKFANLRLSYAYLMTHPGKKLLFMGQELGEPAEWDETRMVDWSLAQQDGHAGLAALVKDLNRLYRESPELYALDDRAEGFEWINHLAAAESCLTFLRKGGGADQIFLVAANFSGVERKLAVGVPRDGRYKEILNTDDVRYGGEGIVNPRAKAAKPVERDCREQSVSIRLAPLAMSILRYLPYTEKELDKREQKGQKLPKGEKKGAERGRNRRKD